MPAKKAAKKSASKAATGFTAEEKAAMREAARERKAQASGADEEQVCRDKIAAMDGPDRVMAQKIHAIMKANGLSAKTWYGMPAYAKDGAVICFFQDAKKFKARYATLGFSDKARLDDGRMWPTSYALMDITPADEAKIVAMVKKAVG